MNKKGFATSAILYTMLLLFFVLMVGILNNLQNKKTILDQLKLETVNAIESSTNTCQLLQEQINQLQNELDSGRKLIAVALNNKGIEASDTDSFEAMADHINSYTPEYTIGKFHVVQETSASISWDKTQSQTIQATYTPTKDCMFMCYAYATGSTGVYMSDATSNMPGTKIIQTPNSFNSFVNIGFAKAGEPITCDYYGKTTNSYVTLYIEIHTNE